MGKGIGKQRKAQRRREIPADGEARKLLELAGQGRWESFCRCFFRRQSLFAGVAEVAGMLDACCWNALSKALFQERDMGAAAYLAGAVLAETSQDLPLGRDVREAAVVTQALLAYRRTGAIAKIEPPAKGPFAELWRRLRAAERGKAQAGRRRSPLQTGIDRLAERFQQLPAAGSARTALSFAQKCEELSASMPVLGLAAHAAYGIRELKLRNCSLVSQASLADWFGRLPAKAFSEECAPFWRMFLHIGAARFGRSWGAVAAFLLERYLPGISGICEERRALAREVLLDERAFGAMEFRKQELASTLSRCLSCRNLWNDREFTMLALAFLTQAFQDSGIPRTPRPMRLALEVGEKLLRLREGQPGLKHFARPLMSAIAGLAADKKAVLRFRPLLGLGDKHAVFAFLVAAQGAVPTEEILAETRVRPPMRLDGGMVQDFCDVFMAAMHARPLPPVSPFHRLLDKESGKVLLREFAFSFMHGYTEGPGGFGNVDALFRYMSKEDWELLARELPPDADSALFFKLVNGDSTLNDDDLLFQDFLDESSRDAAVSLLPFVARARGFSFRRFRQVCDSWFTSRPDEFVAMSLMSAAVLIQDHAARAQAADHLLRNRHRWCVPGDRTGRLILEALRDCRDRARVGLCQVF